MSRSSRPRGARLLVLTAATVAVAGAGLCAAPLATAAPTAAPAATPVTGGGFVPVTAQRVLDTRSGLGLAGKGKLGPNATLTSSMVNRNGLPAAGVASAVILNLTSANSTAGSYLTAYPADAATRPTTSSLNFPGGVTIANTVVVPIHSDGKIAVYNAVGSTDVVADVVGYYAAAENASYGGLSPVLPERIYDSRDGDGPLVTGDGVDLPADFGDATVNAEVTGFVLNVTAVSPTGSGYFTAWDGSGTKPGTSALNFRKGVTAANLVEVKRGDFPNPAGGADLPSARIEATTFGGSSGLAVDVIGYYTKSGAQTDARFVALDSPTRILDTRVSGQGPNLAPETVRTVPTSVGGSATGILMTNLTVAGPTAPTYVSVFPFGNTPPSTSTINANKGAVVANAAVVTLSQVGTPASFQAYNSAGTTPFLVDVSGYFDWPTPVAAAARPAKAAAPVVHAVRS